MKNLTHRSRILPILFLLVLFFSCQSYASSNTVDLLITTKDVNIGGTLILPSDQRTKSLVIMSSGSGPQDRDETLFGFKIFKVLAEYLAEQGIATFRYDDRGVGSSTGDFANSTLDDLAHDVEDIMAYFKKSKNYTFKAFVLFGHSQGGIVASNVAAQNPAVKQLVLMGAPAVPLGDLVLSQLRLDYAESGLSPALIEGEVSAHATLLRALYDDKNIDAALRKFKESYTHVLKAQSSTKSFDDAKIKQLVLERANEHKIVYALPSLASFIYHDPVEDLKALKIPVLSLVGARDAQVSIEQNKDRMENALLKAGVPYQFEVLNDANHFFQKANTGLKDEYDTLDKAFVDGFLHAISTWILKN